MFEDTLSIDLGASYTKVAYRRVAVPNGIGTIRKGAEILMVDNRPLIPSLAIRTRDAGRPWEFGRVAAQMRPSSEMQVFQNWKANLFGSRNDQDSATAVIIAHRFFEWLGAKLESAGINLKKCQTRVAMPAFETFDEKARLIARCMDLSGWNDPSLILKVREPHANTIGLFSKGRNVVARNAEGLEPNYGEMFGQGNVYIQAARGFALFDNHANLITVAVVDIGAFTTDLAALTFDVTAPADGLSAIDQESHAVGVINELDKPLFSALGNQHGFAQSELTFEESEATKLEIYRDRPNWPVGLLTRSQGNIELGDVKDREMVATHIAIFTAAVWEKIAAFVEKERPAKVFLTGGGSMIQPVAAKLREALNETGISVGVVEEGVATKETAQWRPWEQTGEGLQRLATAVGGASVILQQASAIQVQHGHGRPHQREPIGMEQTGPINCRCQGGNKDCCFCNGRGEIAKV